MISIYRICILCRNLSKAKIVYFCLFKIAHFSSWSPALTSCPLICPSAKKQKKGLFIVLIHFLQLNGRSKWQKFFLITCNQCSLLSIPKIVFFLLFKLYILPVARKKPPAHNTRQAVSQEDYRFRNYILSGAETPTRSSAFFSVMEAAVIRARRWFVSCGSSGLLTRLLL